MTTATSECTLPLEQDVVVRQLVHDLSSRASGWPLPLSGVHVEDWSIDIGQGTAARPIAQKGIVAPPHEFGGVASFESALYAPKTALGRRLMEIRARIVRSGAPLLTWHELDRELEQRRGDVESRV